MADRSSVFLTAALCASAGPLAAQLARDPAHPIPVEKGLPAAWLASLSARGEPTMLRGWDELRYVGMPAGGIGCGTVYLGGDGRLWCWDVFNQRHEGVVPNTLRGREVTDPFGGAVRERDGANFVRPVVQSSPWQVDLGFAVKVGDDVPRPLDRTGFRDVEFEWRWPIGIVRYSDPDVPVRVVLEAFSPFVPLDAGRSSYPATVLRWRIENASNATVPVEVRAAVVNPVLRFSPAVGSRVRATVPFAAKDRGRGVLCTVAAAGPAGALRADVMIDDFEREGWGGWTAEGEAFAGGPFRWAERASYHDLRGHGGQRLVTSHNTRRAASCAAADALTGTLVSAPFRLERHFVNMKLAGGRRPDDEFVELLVDGERLAWATGHDGNDLRPVSLDARSAAGKLAVLRVVDRGRGGWGNLTLDDVVLSDGSVADAQIEALPDLGSFAVCAVHGDTEVLEAAGERGSLRAVAAVAPHAAAELPFVIAWHFPNLADSVPAVPGLAAADRQRHYAARFPDAGAVAAEVAAGLDELTRLTRLWADTWYGGTLPRWLLERTLANACALQTTTFHRFRNGHVWGWEGTGCCEGTCTHVWHYAQSLARLFPELERDLRHRTDFGIAYRDDGMIDHRGGLGVGDAVDGQAGVVLRTYREHQCSADGAFLAQLWPRCRKALEFLIGQDARDGEPDGLLAGAQANTLDAAWYGAVPALSSMYLAALLAGAAMADERSDPAFAARCREIAARGRASFAGLFDRERGWFVQREDPAHLDAIGTGAGCHVDQVLGQGWAWQVGLGEIADPDLVRAALRSLWTSNFAPDMGAVRGSLAAPHLRGRPYALAGHRGLVMCTWPFGGRRSDWERHWQFGYFQECMTGFEHFAAATMIGTGEGDLVEHGLAVERAIHERYAARERNPFNEVECGDHYARAMASHAVFLAVCGFEYHGPNGHLGFLPRVRPEDFAAAFTAAAGWGTIAQRRTAQRQTHVVDVAFGELTLLTLAVALPRGASAREVRCDGEPAAFVQQGERVLVTLPAPRTLRAGERLAVVLRW
ncbi:MAG: hypothetical protein FJ265_06015 [Planctomycetes bacterium]|nr:hypothetical protein [Planctomycetota bacterium]